MTRTPTKRGPCATAVVGSLVAAVLACGSALGGWKDQYATARILFDEQQYAEAIAALEQALGENSVQTPAYVPQYYLGLCRFYLGDPEGAERHLQIMRSDPAGAAVRGEVDRALETIRTWRILQPEANAAADEAAALASGCLLPPRERDAIRVAAAAVREARFPADAGRLANAIESLAAQTATLVSRAGALRDGIGTAGREVAAEFSRQGLPAVRTGDLEVAIARLEQRAGAQDPLELSAAAQEVLRQAAVAGARSARLAGDQRWARGVGDAAGALERSVNARDCSAGADLLRSLRRALAAPLAPQAPVPVPQALPPRTAPAPDPASSPRTPLPPDLRDQVARWLERAAAGDYEPAARELSRLAGQQAGGLRARLHLLAGAYFHAAALVGPAKSAAARQRGDAEFASGLAADPDARLPASAFSPQILELLEQVRRSHAGTGAPQEARR